MAAFRFQQQKEMLPFLLNLSTFGSDVFHRLESANIGREVQRSTGGLGVYGQQNAAAAPVGGVLSGALGGALQGAGSFAGLGLSLEQLGLQREQGALQKSLLEQILGGR